MKAFVSIMTTTKVKYKEANTDAPKIPLLYVIDDEFFVRTSIQESWMEGHLLDPFNLYPLVKRAVVGVDEKMQSLKPLKRGPLVPSDF